MIVAQAQSGHAVELEGKADDRIVIGLIERADRGMIVFLLFLADERAVLRPASRPLPTVQFLPSALPAKISSAVTFPGLARRGLRSAFFPANWRLGRRAIKAAMVVGVWRAWDGWSRG